MERVYHHLPTDAEMRRRIAEIGIAFQLDEVLNAQGKRAIPRDIDAETVRLGFMFQYLVAGRITEVFGKHGPSKGGAFRVDFDGEPAVLFAVKTAKRKVAREGEMATTGRLRPCAMPLDRKYEPWAKPVLEYFEDKVTSQYPFLLRKNPDSSKRYAQFVAEFMFRGLEWPMAPYRTGAKAKRGKKSTLKTRGMRWEKCTSHTIRKRRTLTLMLYHKHGPFDLACFGGWTEKSVVEAMPDALKHYLWLDIEEGPELVYLLKEMAERYFPKMLIPPWSPPKRLSENVLPKHI